MTVSEFVERKFIPGHVALRRPSGQAHYHAMLKHVLPPEEVDRMFRISPGESRKRLKAVPGWPYLDNLRLRDVGPDHILRLTSAALSHGYSIQTVKHIRNVISAIFSHAKQNRYFMGDNPVSLIKPPQVHRKPAFALTLAQAKEALDAMRYPEKEMMLLAVFAGMNPAEISGLQWKQVNQTDELLVADGKPIAPKTIAVRKQLYRGDLQNVKETSVRDVTIPDALLTVLLQLRRRANFTGPDDFVLVSRKGTPVNRDNMITRKLKPIAHQLGVPSLSWQVFRRTRTTLASELDKSFQDVSASLVPPAPRGHDDAHHAWRCRPQRRHGGAHHSWYCRPQRRRM
jgi:integrase